MRVIGGVAKGRKLTVPKGYKVRPTAGKVKEALFNMLGEKVLGSKVLDLYAGSGSLGIEALSRGAKLAVFVEKNVASIKTLNKNLKIVDFPKKAKVFKGDVLGVLKELTREKIQFDLIFLDPPYKIDVTNLNRVFEILKEGSFLSRGGVLVWEHSSKVIPFERLGTFNLEFSRVYGDTSLSFYKE